MKFHAKLIIASVTINILFILIYLWAVSFMSGNSWPSYLKYINVALFPFIYIGQVVSNIVNFLFGDSVIYLTTLAVLILNIFIWYLALFSLIKLSKFVKNKIIK